MASIRQIERKIARDLGSLRGKKARPTIPKSVKDIVWAKYIGMDKAEGKCYVCGRTIHITDFEVGHNRAIAKGGSDHPDNLRPICKSCNRSMGTMSIEAFKRKYFLKSKKKTTKKIRYTCDAGKPRPLICPGYLKASSKCKKVKMLDGKPCPHLHYSTK